jgi:hypothetical protein
MIGRRASLVACAALLTAAFAAGCGDDDNAGEGASNNDAVIEQAEKQSYDEASVRQELLDKLPGAVEIEPDEIGYAPPGTGEVQEDVSYSPCSVAVILIGADAIETYKSAGDEIITTSDGEAGVKITTGQDVNAADCLRPAADVLERMG